MLCTLFCICLLISISATQHYVPFVNVTPDTDLMQEMEDRGLFYTLNPIFRMCNIKKKLNAFGLRELLDAYNRSHVTLKNRMRKYPEPLPRPFINIESIYASGRTRTCKLVAYNILGKYLTSPPRYLKELRRFMHTDLQKKVYYALSKYSTALQVKTNLLTSPVVLERYWLDHAAFIIAKAFSDENLPPEGSPIYNWPRDLLRPDIIFFINATTSTPDNNYTDFTNRLMRVYRRIRGPKIIELSPSEDRNNSTAHIILQYIFSMFPKVPPTTTDSSLTYNLAKTRRRVY